MRAIAYYYSTKNKGKFKECQPPNMSILRQRQTPASTMGSRAPPQALDRGIVEGLIYWLEVSAVQVERYRAEVFGKKPARITVNKESEFGPLGKKL